MMQPYMSPSNELRFVEREAVTPYGNDDAEVRRTVRMLQQKWYGYSTDPLTGSIIPPTMVSEWRDVPVEKETP
jgi:hypothetical protein